MTAKLIMIIGFPASGKSSFAKRLATEQKTRRRNVEVLSRDDYGGNIADLVPKVAELLKLNKVVILDNTHLTKEVRKPFIDLAKELNVPIEAFHVKNTIEDSQVKVLHRMYIKYNRLFLTGKPEKGSDAAGDPGVFPPAALFAARKRFEPPTVEEGFAIVTVEDAHHLKWDGRKYKGKAVFFDVDGTLRETEDLPLKYPTDPSQVKLYRDAKVMKNKIAELMKDGYKLIGVSNQSGIAKKSVTEDAVKACMARTRELLGLTEKDMPIMYCPHSPAPITCYCRKPQVGMLMTYIESMKLNPTKCIMVGDSKSDETAATRLGIKFVHSNDFWK